MGVRARERNRVIFVCVVVVGSDRIGSDQHLQVGKGPVVGCSKVLIASITSWMDDGPMGFARMILLVHFRAIMTVSSRCHHFGTQAFLNN